MIKSKKIIYCFLGIILLSCSQQPQNILQSPSVLPSITIIPNQTPITTSTQQNIIITGEPEITGTDSSGKNVVCQPIEKALENLSVKCPQNIAVSKDGKSIYFTNYSGGLSDDPIECQQPPKDEISFINKINNNKLDIVRLDDNKPFYICGSSLGDLQIDKENSLYYNDLNIKKITSQGKILTVTNDKFKNYMDCKNSNSCTGYDTGNYMIRVTDDNVYYMSTTVETFPENRTDFIKRQDKNSKSLIVTEGEGLYPTRFGPNYAVYNNDIYVLDFIPYDSSVNGFFKIVKLPDNYPVIFSQSNKIINQNLTVISNLNELRTDNDIINNYVTCMKTNSKGEIFFNDIKRNIIWKVTPKQGEEVPAVIFAGSSKLGFKDGKGQQAEFNHPSSFDFDGNDNIYVADMGNNAIRKITPDGTVTTFYK